MIENELSQHYKHQTKTAHYYLDRYISELKSHFWLDDYHIIKILEREIKTLKRKNPSKLWGFFFKNL